MLKRPTEKHWKFQQPPTPFPQCPISAVMLAPSGQSKTTTIVSMMLGPYRIFESIHVYSPSVFIDSAWEPVIEFSKTLKDCTFSAEWDEDGLLEIMDNQKNTIKLLKDAKTEKPLPQILIIIDDWADSPMLHSSTNILTTLMIRGRHLAASCWVSSQHLRAISTVIRNNVKFLGVRRLRNAKEIAALMEDLSALYPIPVLREMYESAISDAPYSFWHINMMAPKAEMMMVRFEDYMVVD